jgi:branched-subunit amino acid ABC-type transport system permease component
MNEVAQLLANGLMAGAMLAVPALGFNMIFAVLRISNFSLAALITVGGYAGLVTNVVLDQPAVVAIAVAFLVTGAVGVVSDQLALKPLRRYGPISVAIASLALNMVLENILRFCFGNDMQALDVAAQRDWTFGDIRIGPQQFYNFLIAAVIMAALFCLLRFTRIGKAMRAVADNPSLADIKGINPGRIAQVAVFLGAGLAGLTGILLSLDTAVDPTMGMRLILSVFAGAVLGGLGSIPGAVAGGLLIGVAEEMSLLVMPVAYRSAVGFLAILVALVFFPRGILGDR